MTQAGLSSMVVVTTCCGLLLHGHYYTLLSGFNLHILRFIFFTRSTGWKLPIAPTSLNLLPTFGRIETTPSSSSTSQLSTTNCAMLRPPAFQSLSPYPQAVPSKLVKKILALRYVDMSELLSEHYDNHNGTESTCCSHTTKSIRWPPVSNIIVWLDCYASLVSVSNSIVVLFTVSRNPLK